MIFAKGEPIFHLIVIYDWYDGPILGLARSRSGIEFGFRNVALGESNPVYHVVPAPVGMFKALTRTLADRFANGCVVLLPEDVQPAIREAGDWLKRVFAVPTAGHLIFTSRNGLQNLVESSHEVDTADVATMERLRDRNDYRGFFEA